MATIVITGGTGLVGTALTQYFLSNLHKVIILTRAKKESTTTDLSYAEWNVDKQTIDLEAIQQADYIVHLAGANVAEKRWTAERKQEILQSRTRSSSLIVNTLKNNPHKVKAIISASAIGWYGPDGNSGKPFNESARPFTDYLASTCKAWEESLDDLERMHVRLVKLRTGIVLTTEGGALAEFMKPLRFGFATIMASGRQMVSWIHIQDLVRMYDFAIQHDELNGVYNAVAPHPVSNKELVFQLAKLVRGKMYMTINVPSFALKAALGEMSIEVLKSCTVSSNKIREAGFKFYFPSIEPALKDLVKRIR